MIIRFPPASLGFEFLSNGEGGIRTLGWALLFHQQISNLPLSTTQPPLPAARSIIADLFGEPLHSPQIFEGDGDIVISKEKPGPGLFLC